MHGVHTYATYATYLPSIKCQPALHLHLLCF